MLGKGNDKCRDADRGGIVGTFLECRMGMADGRGAIRFAVAAALKTRVEAPRKHRVGGRAMFLTCWSPSSSNPKSTLSRTWSRTTRLTQIPPGSAKASSRAATLTPSP
jgi:hypothetical protein